MSMSTCDTRAGEIRGLLFEGIDVFWLASKRGITAGQRTGLTRRFWSSHVGVGKISMGVIGALLFASGDKFMIPHLLGN